VIFLIAGSFFWGEGLFGFFCWGGYITTDKFNVGQITVRKVEIQGTVFKNDISEFPAIKI
jgi:hypothetical protein